MAGGALLITWVLCTRLWDDVLSVFDDRYEPKKKKSQFITVCKHFHGQAYH